MLALTRDQIKTWTASSKAISCFRGLEIIYSYDMSYTVWVVNLLILREKNKCYALEGILQTLPLSADTEVTQ